MKVHSPDQPAPASPASVRAVTVRGRPARISRQSIATAAAGVGFEQLTVAAVADELGTSAAALYHHVRDRDELVAIAVEEVVDTAHWPDPALPWREYLRGVGCSTWDLFDANPGLAGIAATMTSTPPSVRRRFHAACSALLGHGFEATSAVLAVDTVLDLAVDSSARAALVEETPQTLADRTALVDQADPSILEALTRMTSDVPRSWFDRKLEVVLAGLATQDGVPS
ncbi:MAG: TetR/AcrR family transcriptional regulator [Phycicoccus sp.]